MQRFGVGIVGCGNICGIYLKTCPRFENLQVISCSDLDLDRAKAAASEHNVSKAYSFEEMLADPEVDIVLNLTVPKVHAAINNAALDAGKHVYTEKPLGITRAEGKETIEKAKARGLRVGGAPDTFLGAGLQTCRKLIDDGCIGRPVSATAFMMGHGVEAWHPNPNFFYQKGGGPMLDMGPYYLTALTTLIGPVKRLCGLTSKAFEERINATESRRGEKIPVETPTHIAGLMEFAQGAVGTIVTSFDVWGHHTPLLEIHGTEGSLSVPDPNTFGGPVQYLKPGAHEWEEMPLTHPFAENTRGLGVADMAQAIAQDRPARASGDLCFHVLDIMESFADSSDSGQFVELTSGIERPAPMPLEVHGFE
jgi:predicted dehydrogenase